MFTEIFTYIDNIAKELITALQGDFAQLVASILTLSITLYIVIFAYMVLAGKIETPLSDLAWTLAKWTLVIAFINNSDGWLTLTYEAVMDFKNSDVAFNGRTVDNFISVVNEEIDRGWDATGTGLTNLGQQLMMILYQVIGWFIILCCAGLVFMALFSVIILAILFSTAPLFIFFMMWGFLRPMFSGWLSAIFSNILLVIFAGSFLRMAQFMLERGGLNPQSDDAFGILYSLMTIPILIIGAALSFVFAQAIANVSVDAAGAGAAKSALNSAKDVSKSTAKGAYKAGKGAYKAGKGAYKAGKGAYKAGKGIAKGAYKAGKDIAKGAYKAGKSGGTALLREWERRRKGFM